MKKLFKNKYRIGSHRKPGWDYDSDAFYFLTIVTQDRVSNLGEINENAEMVLSDFGKIVESEWMKSFEIRNELYLHDFVIMPNHIHCIVEIWNGKQMVKTNVEPVEMNGRSFLPDEIPNDIIRNMPIRLPKSISSFIAGFKSAVNRKIDDYIDEFQLNIPKYNRRNHFFQPNYHDHIIRNNIEFSRIRNYIINNPVNWKLDKLKH